MNCDAVAAEVIKVAFLMTSAGGCCDFISYMVLSFVIKRGYFYSLQRTGFCVCSGIAGNGAAFGVRCFFTVFFSVETGET